MNAASSFYRSFSFVDAAPRESSTDARNKVMRKRRWREEGGFKMNMELTRNMEHGKQRTNVVTHKIELSMFNEQHMRGVALLHFYDFLETKGEKREKK